MDAETKNLRGRDADKIAKDARALRERIKSAEKLSAKARRRLLAGVNEVLQSAESGKSLVLPDQLCVPRRVRLITCM